MDAQCRELKTYVPLSFDDLAKRFNLAPDYLAYVILAHFAENPEILVLVSNDPKDARRDTEPIQL